ncbi:MAG: hypothetical protein ACON5F_11910 [Jejuia sp.]
MEYGIFKMIGYGFIDKTEQINTTEDFETFLIRQQDNSDVQKIIRRVLVDRDRYRF